MRREPRERAMYVCKGHHTRTAFFVLFTTIGELRGVSKIYRWQAEKKSVETNEDGGCKFLHSDFYITP